jgi:hypothetical protein
VRPTGDAELWYDLMARFSENAVAKYWSRAASKYGFRTTWRIDRLAAVIVLAFEDRWSFERSILSKPGQVGNEYRARLLRYVGNVVRRENIVQVGVIAVTAPPMSPGSRPGLTLVLESPHGASDAARIALTHFEEHGFGGMIARQVRYTQYVVVKFICMPEWYVYFDDQLGGVDWEAWKTFAAIEFDRHFEDAVAVWCDSLLGAFLQFRERFPSLIANATIDWYEAQAFVTRDTNHVVQKLSEIESSGFKPFRDAVADEIDLNGKPEPPGSDGASR